MERRSWPWKKKSSDDKYNADKGSATSDSVGDPLESEGSQNAKDTYKKTTYVQISVESYAHLNGLEDQVNVYEEQVKMYKDHLKALQEQTRELNEKLSEAHTETTNKDELVKQHAKVAEEAVSGWEKAEAEAAALKTHLEAVTLTKLTAEDRAAQLDGALKECMRQIRNLKEENERKVQDVVLTKNKQYDNMKLEFEAKIAAYDHELRRAQGENDALSRSLQERSTMLIKMSEEKSQAEAEIELLKNNIESCEREINSLKYELHIVSKELQIRNEEKTMTAKSAEVANKQHMEGAKKIAKLEAECQRLRSLVRKKLPGPAALAQMKLEVEYQGYGDSRFRRSPVRPASPHMSPITEFSVDGAQKFHKENDFLTERLMDMEEETKMLKEALAKRNSELQESRSMSARTANKLQSLEAQLYTLSQQKGSGERPSVQSATSPPSLASMSEDGKDSSIRSDNTNHLELMDDFLEMEQLAGLPSDSNGSISTTGASENKESMNRELNGDNGAGFSAEEQPDKSLVMKIKSRISEVFESVSADAEIGKVLEKLKHIVQEAYDIVQPYTVTCVVEEKSSSANALFALKKEISLLENGGIHGTEKEKVLNKEMVAAITEIHTFILSLVDAAGVTFQGTSDDEHGLNQKAEQFTATFSKVLCSELSLADFVVALSHVAEKASDLSFKIVGYKNGESESTTPDCIDKVALPGNKESQGERYTNGCSHVCDSSSNPEYPSEANFLPSLDEVSCKCSMEGVEKLKVEKDNMAQELARFMEDLEATKSQLKETEEVLADVKSQLASSQKTNSLSETQLKCMAGSYNSLEKKAEELETEVNLLRTRVESVEIELQSEKASHQDALIRCKDLEEQLQRNKECSACASMAADLEKKNKQEKELAAAAEKLAECQETILLLGKQLNALHPQTEVAAASHSNRHDKELVEDGSTTSGVSSRDLLHQIEIDTASSTNSRKVGSESPVYLYDNPSSPSETENPRLSVSAAPEKHSRGFSRFFTSKSSSRH